MPPGWDGVETTQRILAVDPDIQIVICTAYADYSWEEMFEKIGNRDGLLILKKPFDTVEALQLAHALTEKWWLHQQSRQKVEELESRVAGRTRELQQSNDTLQEKIVEHERAQDEVRWKTAFLEAQVTSSMDGNWWWTKPEKPLSKTSVFLICGNYPRTSPRRKAMPPASAGRGHDEKSGTVHTKNPPP